MRTPSATTFHDTLNYCFISVLTSLGESFKDQIYEVLEKKGVRREDISSRFEHVTKVLTESLGPSARVLLFKTVEALYGEYSVPTQVSYYDSLNDRIAHLQSKVETEHLHPKQHSADEGRTLIGNRNR